MNLYRIEKKECTWDSFEKFLIAADDVSEVLPIAIAAVKDTSGYNVDTCDYAHFDEEDPELSEDNVNIDLVGIAKAGTKTGVVMHSFKRG